MDEKRKKEEVEAFLGTFKAKMRIMVPAVLYLDHRPKNTQTLVDLQMIPSRRDEILMSLEAKDFCDGPIDEKAYGGSPMWVFGKNENGTELYIKVTLGVSGASVLCISFHKAEASMKYYFK